MHALQLAQYIPGPETVKAIQAVGGLVGASAGVIKSVGSVLPSRSIGVELGKPQQSALALPEASKPWFPWPSVWQVLVTFGVVSLKFQPLRPVGAAFIVTGGCLYGVGVWWRNSRSPIGASVSTRHIQASLRLPPLSSSEQRQVFAAIPLVKAGPTKNHTHGASAATRNAGAATAELIANAMGREPYYVQMSLADARRGRSGDRSFHWAKDLAVPPAEFSFDPTTQVAVLVDVDYYIDMPALLASKPGTYLISTFQPTEVALSTGEYTFRFLSDNRVQYRVSGGAKYTHELWDYSGDTITVEQQFYAEKRVVAYHIDRKRLDDHHTLVMLSLIGTFSTYNVISTPLVLGGESLTRLRPVFGQFIVMDIVRKEGLFRSVAILGDHTAVTLPKSKFDAIRAAGLATKNPVSPAIVATNIAPSDPIGLPTERLPPGHGAILACYLRAGVPLDPPEVYPPSDCVIPIWYAKYDHDAKVPLAGFGSPLIGPCYAYADSIASDHYCVVGRVERFTIGRQSEPLTSVPPSSARHLCEFVKFLVPVPHTGEPVSIDVVKEKQSKASQKHIIEEAEVTGANVKKAKWRTFKKKETAVKPSDPRNISMTDRKSVV